MKTFILVLTIVALFFSVAYAYDGWGKGKIIGIRVQGGRVLINQESMINPGGCASLDYYHLEASESSFDRNRYATLLAAYITGREVWLALNGCESGYPFISEIWLR